MSVSSVTSQIGDALLKVAQKSARYLPEPIATGVKFASSLDGVRDSNSVDISPEYRDLLERQLETQQELQQVTFTSNIERSQHEARMAAVRNIRVS